MKILKKVLPIIMILALVFTCMPSNLASAKDEDSVNYVQIDSLAGLQNHIDTDGEFSSQNVYPENQRGKSSVYKISVDEAGWIFIRNYSSQSNYTKCALYSNFALTNKLAEDKEMIATYVPAGNYYYQVERWNGYEELTATCYVGFMPSSEKIKVDKITYSKDKSAATVTFDYDEDYLVDFLTGTIRVIKKDVPYTELTNNTTWSVSNRENALEKNSFKATSNGIYTARIANGEYFHMTTFEITGLKSNKPAAPKFAEFKKSTKAIKGTAPAYSSVVVKVSGKSYKATADSKGKWNIKLSSSLKKGQKVTGYVKNQAGVKSKTSSVTVK